MENEIIIVNTLKDLMYNIAKNSYNNHYSSSSYQKEIDTYQIASGVILDLCAQLNIDVSDLKVDYCGYEIEYEDLVSFKSYTRWF